MPAAEAGQEAYDMQPNDTAIDRMSVEDVKARWDRGEPVVFLDTRNPTAWGDADTKLPGALRVPADEVEQHLQEILRDRPVVTYCT
jgi:rhodanese-related sulfurtransferase